MFVLIYIMPKRRRAEAARKGWKKRNSNEREACGLNRKKRELWDDSSMTKAMEAVKMEKWALIEPQKSTMCQGQH